MSKSVRVNCGDSSEDWGVFDVLCGQKHNNSCCHKGVEDCECTVDIVTTLRSELGALSSKTEQLQNKLFEVKGQLSAKEADYESLRSQTARQTALIASLQNRLENAEKREKCMQSRCEGSIQTMKHEKRASEEQVRQLLEKIQQLESNVANAKIEKDQIDQKFCNFLNCLGDIFHHNEFTINQLSPEYILMHVNEVVAELERTKAKIHSTCQTLNCCENELSSLKKISSLEKQRLVDSVESAQIHNKELEARNKQLERELQLNQERLTDSELCLEKMKDELRGLESRCYRIQNKLDRTQTERLQFMRTLAKELNILEPCETIIKENIREILNDNNLKNAQLKTLSDQLSSEKEKFKEFQEQNQCLLLTGETQKCELEERLEKYQTEIHEVNNERLTLLDFLKRLAHVLSWKESLTSMDISCIASILLERVQNIVIFCENYGLQMDMCDAQYNAPAYRRIRRERTCHDMPLKESTSVFNLQRRVRILREQIQKRDFQLELLKKKFALLENSTNENFMLQNERDDAFCRLKKASKQIDKLSAQLVDAKCQITNVRAQLAEAIEYKLNALEQARKIDELAKENRELIKEKSHMLDQINKLKEHMKSIDSCSEKQQCHDENLIKTLRKTLSHLESQLADVNCRLSQSNTFRCCIERALNLQDMPQTDMLQRLKLLCSAHREFQPVPKHFVESSPQDHQCCSDNNNIQHKAYCNSASLSDRDVSLCRNRGRHNTSTLDRNKREQKHEHKTHHHNDSFDLDHHNLHYQF